MQHKAKILIIDDEKQYLDVLVEILQHDYRIIVAKNGEQGLARLNSSDLPQLILLDVLMPGIDGYETCRRIKADPHARDIPVIFLTARDDVEGETYGLGLGAVDYITKPISPPTVRARIRTHLALRAARLELELQNQGLEDRVKERTESLRLVSAELVLAEERERRRIAQELHDGPAQRLALSKMNLGRLRSAVDPAHNAAFDEVLRDIDTTLKELRTLMVDLSPSALYELGLGPAVEWLAETILGKHGIDFRVDSAEAYGNLREETRVFLFQSIRELLINVVKHAQASRTSISLNTHEGDMVIEIRDDGVGMPQPTLLSQPGVSGGFGLFALRDRIDMLGGKMQIARNGGTHVMLQVPLSQPEHTA
ncbi:MAG: response regulator [Gammaproteobacteria bacterium]|nr:response regulator [Gammaproteobacteria bacterium]